MAIPVVLDTDIGDDIDDALVLAAALGSREIELVAVTTVFARSALRAALARHLLAAYGRQDIPVFSGSDRPLVEPLPRDWAPNQAMVLGAADAGAGPSPETAAAAIVRYAHAHVDPVLLCVGAMTNAALALLLDPRIARRLRIVAMAGAWDRDQAEWNVRCDPEAVASVLQSGVAVDFVGLDVTTRVTLPEADLAALVACPAPAQQALVAFVRAWQRGWNKPDDFCPVLHDPLALAAVCRPELLRFEAAAVSVDLSPGPRRGRTEAGVAAGPAVRIARDVDAAAFYADLRARLLPPG